jgi:hypothetical protein
VLTGPFIYFPRIAFPFPQSVLLHSVARVQLIVSLITILGSCGCQFSWRAFALTLVTANNYEVTHSKDHCNYSTHNVCSVFTSRCLVAAFNGGRSSYSGLPNCPRRQLPAFHFSQLQLSTVSATTGLSVKLLLAFASTGIPGFRLLESQSQNHWRFTSSHFVLTPSLLWFTTSIFFNRTFAVIVLMWHPLWREDGPVVYNCCWPSPVQSFSGPSPVFCSQIRDSPNLEGQVPVFISPRNRVPISSPPTTHRVTVELLESASTRDSLLEIHDQDCYSLLDTRCWGNSVFTVLFPINGCCAVACLHSCYLAVGSTWHNIWIII